MPKILEMPPHLADLIAAGEVVERPASVVKELCENAIDAGARSLTVEIRNGGMSLIRVTDDGCGIAAEDAETAFLRHATSKLRDEQGLEAIGTLGFRGEALAAISAVSRIELVTREAQAQTGLRLLLEGGAVVSREEAGCPVGTTMIVRDLFFNTPARLKFTKNDRAEGAAVTAAVTRIALSHPELSLKYLRDGKEELHTPGDGRINSAVYSALGRELAAALLPAEGEVDGIGVHGFISSPNGSRGNRSWQFFFINGRFVRSKLLQAALEQGYKNSLFTGRFPVCVLNLTLPFDQVDVNVHPAKTEVRFSNEKQVFDAVYWTVLGALEKEDRPATLQVSPSTRKLVTEPSAPAPAPAETAPAAPRREAFRTLTAETYKTTYHQGNGGFRSAVLPSGTPRRPAETALSLNDYVQETLPLPPAPPPAPEEPPRPAPPERSWRYVGETMNTYLLVEKANTLYLIDKHAAHERILFDKLKAGLAEADSQILLEPLILRLSAEAAALVVGNAPLLAEFGFVVEDFGGDAVAVRQMPIDIALEEPTAFFEELAEALSHGGRQELSALRDELMHTVACKAAIKAGTPSDPATVAGLIEKVLAGEVRYCPHGRPVTMELTKYQLDRNFKRL